MNRLVVLAPPSNPLLFSFDLLDPPQEERTQQIEFHANPDESFRHNAICLFPSSPTIAKFWWPIGCPHRYPQAVGPMYLLATDDSDRIFWMAMGNSLLFMTKSSIVRGCGLGAMRPFEHYIPVNADLSDALDKVALDMYTRPWRSGETSFLFQLGGVHPPYPRKKSTSGSPLLCCTDIFLAR